MGSSDHMQEHKRKHYPKWWSWDEKSKSIKRSIKKYINSVERQRGKKEVRDQVQELHDKPTLDKEDRFSAEIEQHYTSSPCLKCLLDYAALDKLGYTFYRLGFIVLTDYDRNNYFCEHNRK